MWKGIFNYNYVYWERFEHDDNEMYFFIRICNVILTK